MRGAAAAIAAKSAGVHCVLGDVETDHGDMPVGGEDPVGGMRIGPDVGLGGHIAVPGGASPITTTR